MSKIKSIHAHEILDSRGNPTLEVELISDDGKFTASVPSGASTGIYEAIELRDNDKNRYGGKGVLKAVSNVEKIIAPALAGMDVTKQKEIDDIMIKLDGTSNKKRLGANAILGVSMAVCRAGAGARKIPLYKYIGELAENKKMIMPVPSFNIINGGRHAKNKLQFQEFMIMPVGANSFHEALNLGKRVYDVLKEIVQEEYGDLNIGDEGGFAPNINSNEEALELLNKAILKSGCYEKIRIGIDVAASEFFQNGKYNLNKKLSGDEMIAVYKEFIEKYNIVSIEDAFDQDDWKSYSKFNSLVGKKIQIVGDDLLVTNIKRIKIAILKKACNALLLKINQIGTISEAIDAFKLAKKANWNIMVSHRSGETKDSFIADLVVGLGCGEIKSGAPYPAERMAKYNRLVEIEKELGRVEYFGKGLMK